jgi:hypothetical protein
VGQIRTELKKGAQGSLSITRLLATIMKVDLCTEITTRWDLWIVYLVGGWSSVTRPNKVWRSENCAASPRECFLGPKLPN